MGQDPTASGAEDGSSWTDAFSDLQSALDMAVEGDQILVAEGTYFLGKRVQSDDPRSVTFALKEGVAIYGGFPAGGELIMRSITITTNSASIGGGTAN